MAWDMCTPDRKGFAFKTGEQGPRAEHLIELKGFEDKETKAGVLF